jgi:hypothetical protein
MAGSLASLSAKVVLLQAVAVGVGILAAVVPAAGETPLAGSPASTASSSLVTALTDYAVPPAKYGSFLVRARRAGASAIVTSIDWAGTVRSGSAPTGAEQADPAYGGYDWSATDATVEAIVAHRLTPIVEIEDAPSWALGPTIPGETPTVGGGQSNISPAAYGRFARAAAGHYSGRIRGIPGVHYWSAWNEPNISLFLGPQFVGRKPYSPELYRRMLNAFSAGVKAVSLDNLVIAGNTAPFRDITPDVQKVDSDWGPLAFMRDVLCVSPNLAATCSAHVRFDIWAHHPYTSGGPRHSAVLPNDVSIGNLSSIKAVLDAAVKAGHVESASRSPQFWVTEFGWDSKPPDPGGVPMNLLTRWMAEGLYRMWLDGVTLVAWLQLDDLPISTSFNQGGLYFTDTRAKAILNAFRFPFVAYPSRAGVSVWGRTPGGTRTVVWVEQLVHRRWQRLGELAANAGGVFVGDVKGEGRGDLRAVVASTADSSTEYSLVEPPDHVYNPFGTTPLEPKRKNGK